MLLHAWGDSKGGEIAQRGGGRTRPQKGIAQVCISQKEKKVRGKPAARAAREVKKSGSRGAGEEAEAGGGRQCQARGIL